MPTNTENPQSPSPSAETATRQEQPSLAPQYSRRRILQFLSTALTGVFAIPETRCTPPPPLEETIPEREKNERKRWISENTASHDRGDLKTPEGLAKRMNALFTEAPLLANRLMKLLDEYTNQSIAILKKNAGLLETLIDMDIQRSETLLKNEPEPKKSEILAQMKKNQETIKTDNGKTLWEPLFADLSRNLRSMILHMLIPSGALFSEEILITAMEQLQKNDFESTKNEVCDVYTWPPAFIEMYRRLAWGLVKDMEFLRNTIMHIYLYMIARNIFPMGEKDSKDHVSSLSEGKRVLAAHHAFFYASELYGRTRDSSLPYLEMFRSATPISLLVSYGAIQGKNKSVPWNEAIAKETYDLLMTLLLKREKEFNLEKHADEKEKYPYEYFFTENNLDTALIPFLRDFLDPEKGPMILYTLFSQPIKTGFDDSSRSLELVNKIILTALLLPVKLDTSVSRARKEADQENARLLCHEKNRMPKDWQSIALPKDIPCVINTTL